MPVLDVASPRTADVSTRGFSSPSVSPRSSDGQKSLPLAELKPAAKADFGSVGCFEFTVVGTTSPVVSRAALRAYCCALAAVPRRSSPVRRPQRMFSPSRGRVQVFSRVAIVWGAQDPLYKYPFTPFPKPKGCELTLETGPECTEERNHQVMLASGLRTRAVDLRSSAQPHTDGLLLALAGYRHDTRDVEHC